MEIHGDAAAFMAMALQAHQITSTADPGQRTSRMLAGEKPEPTGGRRVRARRGAAKDPGALARELNDRLYDKTVN
jgi:hypothetical protein